MSLGAVMLHPGGGQWFPTLEVSGSLLCKLLSVRGRCLTYIRSLLMQKLHHLHVTFQFGHISKCRRQMLCLILIFIF